MIQLPNTNHENLISWLKKKHKYTDTLDHKFYNSKYNYNAYYNKNKDIDEELKDKFFSDNPIIDEEVYKYTQKYKESKIYFDKNKNIYECNQIFKELIDTTIENNFILKVPIKKENEILISNEYIFDKNMKESLYLFIKKYSI